MSNKFVLIACLAALSVGCVEAEDAPVEPEDRVAEIVDNLIEAGYDESDIEVVDHVVDADGAELPIEPRVVVQGDIHVTLEASRDLVGHEDADGESFRHIHTPQLVNSGQTICLLRSDELLPQIGPALYYPLSTAMMQGVQYARDNYNARNLGLTFEIRDVPLDINGNTQPEPGDLNGCDSTISFMSQPWMPLGGIAGFPSGGDPYPEVIMRGSASNQFFEHIATHEIGHAIGLRHSDWYTRNSCGGGGPEPVDGAFGIPGTPFDTTSSIMAACLPASTNGEFWFYDTVALDYLY